MKSFPSINLEQRLAKDVETFVRAQLDGGSLRELDADTKVLVIDTLLLSRERYDTHTKRSIPHARLQILIFNVQALSLG